MKNFSHIAARVLNTPLLLEQSYARVFFNALAGRLGITELRDGGEVIETAPQLRVSMGQPVPMAYFDDECGSGTGASNTPSAYINDRGVAIIEVSGTLVHKHGYLKPYSGMTGYDGIVRRVALAAADSRVTGILLDMDTPGGEVAGCFDAARKIRQLAASSGKPMWSLCYDMNCSAGMAIASAGSRRIITQTGVAGSVGVLMAHSSFEKYLAEEGIKVTLIHSGRHKVEGNPYQDLPDQVLQKFTAETDALRKDFAVLVASMLGIDESAVLQTEADTYRGQAAVDVGFADELVNGNDAVDLFVEHLSTQGRTTTFGGNLMSHNAQQTGAAAQSDVNTGTTTSTPSASVEAPAAPSVVAVSSIEPTASAERDRIATILGSEEAKGRETLANHLAFKTAISAEDAIATLAAATATEVVGAATPLDAAMQATKQPHVGAAQQGELSETQKQINAIAGAYQTATGNRKA